MKLSLVYHQNRPEQLVWVLVVFSFVRFSFPVTRLMPYYDAETGRSRPPNRLTLQITLLLYSKYSS